VSAFAAVPANRKPAIVKDSISKFLSFFIFFSQSSLFFNIDVLPNYGNVTDRTLAENEPPVYVPAYFSATPAPSVPALPEKLTVKTPDLPAAIDAMVCGIGDPATVPSVAEVRVTLDAAPVPELVTVMVAV
jgi:hypothetical protein